MSLGTELRERLAALFRRAARDRELNEEIQFHLEQEIALRVARGEAQDAARRAALAAFGSIAACRDDVQDARGVRPLTDVAGDLRYSVRALSRARGLALSCVLILGLAIGAAASLFSLADLVLVAELPYPEAGRLVQVHQTNGSLDVFWLSTVDAEAIATQARSFAAFGVVQRSEAALSGAGAPRTVPVGRATPGFFAALQVVAAEGRLLADADIAAAAAPAAVLSHTLAVQLAGSAQAAVGRQLTFDGIGHTVVGVLPAGVDDLGGVRAAAWPALRLTTPTRRGPFWLRGVARLDRGVTIEDAERELATISERLFPLWAASFQDREARLTAVPLRTAVIGRAVRPVGLFAAAVGLLLVIAVVNVATLMLVRASARGPELAVRAALGADRLRLARLLVTETVLVTVLAGAVALGVAVAGVPLVKALARDLPRVHEAVVNWRTAAFIVTVAAACAVLLAASVLSVALRCAAATSVRSDARRSGSSRNTHTWRAVLVGAEFALSVPLLVCAGLLFASFIRLQQVDPGYSAAGLTTTEISLPAARYGTEAAQRFWRQLLERTTALPGVTAAGLTTSVPPDNGGDVNNFDLLDRPVPPGTAQPVAPWSAVDGEYFRALGVPLLDGRTFSATDDGDAPPVVIVSLAWAERYYPRERAVGRRLVSGGCTTCPPSTVVGVVGDVKYLGLRESGEGVYYPAAQDAPRRMALVVRSMRSEGETLRALREVIAGLDPELPAAGAAMSARLAESLADPQRWTALLVAFAVTAVGLASLGAFGLVSYAVRQRRREIGIRMALGADAHAVSSLVARRGLRHVAIGSALGCVIAVVAVRWLQPMLFHTELFDAGPLAAAAVMLLGSAGAACWLPARRAARIAPAEVLADGS